MREPARLVLGVAAIAFLLRLPFLDAGYGWDSDAWRVAAAAAAMAETGNYAAPRLPGNPVHDVAMAVLWWLGPWARDPRVLNGASALISTLDYAWGRARGTLESGGVLYTHLLDGESPARLRAEGRILYFLPGTELAHRDLYGVDLVAAGARPLVP